MKASFASEISIEQPLGQTVEPCPICCGSSALWHRASDHDYGNSGIWNVYRCTACGHMFQHPMPTEKELRCFYPDSYYAHQVPDTDLTPRGLRHRGVWLTLYYLKYFRGYQHLTVWKNRLLACVGSLLDPRPLWFAAPYFSPGGYLLDYGSGSGATVVLMQYVGWYAEGIESNTRAAQAGKDAGLTIYPGSVLSQR